MGAAQAPKAKGHRSHPGQGPSRPGKGDAEKVVFFQRRVGSGQPSDHRSPYSQRQYQAEKEQEETDRKRDARARKKEAYQKEQKEVRPWMIGDRESGLGVS